MRRSGSRSSFFFSLPIRFDSTSVLSSASTFFGFYLLSSKKLTFVDVDGYAKDARSGARRLLRRRGEYGLLPRGGSGAPRRRRRGRCRRRHRRRRRRSRAAPPSRARLRHVEAAARAGRRRMCSSSSSVGREGTPSLGADGAAADSVLMLPPSDEPSTSRAHLRGLGNQSRLSLHRNEGGTRPDNNPGRESTLSLCSHRSKSERKNEPRETEEAKGKARKEGATTRRPPALFNFSEERVFFLFRFSPRRRSH